MTRIVRSHYRYKRPPRKRAKAAAIEGPVIVKAIDPAKLRKRVKAVLPESTSIVSTSKRAGASASATDDGKLAETGKRSAIVTARKPGKRYADVPDVTEEEHRRVGDLADAMMQEFKRKIAEKIRS
jgi:hypothetical protein